MIYYTLQPNAQRKRERGREREQYFSNQKCMTILEIPLATSKVKAVGFSASELQVVWGSWNWTNGTNKTFQNTRKPIYVSLNFILFYIVEVSTRLSNMPFIFNLSYNYLVLDRLSDLLHTAFTRYWSQELRSFPSWECCRDTFDLMRSKSGL